MREIKETMKFPTQKVLDALGINIAPKNVTFAQCSDENGFALM